MKKRLLITSIVMMLVVAVALSTATYAWFTSSANVQGGSISLTAATNDAASLGISWDNINYGTAITAYSPNDASTAPTFQPACPTELTVGTTSLANSVVDHNVVFNTQKATPLNGDMKFIGDGEATPVYTWTDDASSTHTSFFVKNLSPANSINTVTMTANITGAGAALVRVGVFKYDASAGYYKLVAVLAKQESTGYEAATGEFGSGEYYKKYLGKYVLATAGDSTAVANGTADYTVGGTITAGTFYTATGSAVNAQATCGAIASGASVNAMGSVACTDAATGFAVASSLGANTGFELIVKVWLDAVALGDDEHSQVATVALNFTAGAVTASSNS